MTKMIDTWVSALLKFMKISKTPSIAYQVFRHNSGLSWLWSYGNWIYNTIAYAISAYHHWCLWLRISIRARCTTLWDKVCQWFATFWWFSLGPLVSSTNTTDRHDITEIVLKVALDTIKQTNKQTNRKNSYYSIIIFWQHYRKTILEGEDKNMFST
jgi:hypothetical protein